MKESSQLTVIECEYSASLEIGREICISIFLHLGNTFGNVKFVFQYFQRFGNTFGNMECNNFDL